MEFATSEQIGSNRTLDGINGVVPEVSKKATNDLGRLFVGYVSESSSFVKLR